MRRRAGSGRWSASSRRSGKRSGRPLHFVDHRESGEELERRHRLFEERTGARLLQIELGGCRRFEHLAGRRRLSALAWPGQQHDRPTFERDAQCLLQTRAGDNHGEKGSRKTKSAFSFFVERSRRTVRSPPLAGSSGRLEFMRQFLHVLPIDERAPPLPFREFTDDAGALRGRQRAVTIGSRAHARVRIHGRESGVT